MTSPLLPAAWRTFLVVLPEYLDLLQGTLDDLAQRSLRDELVVVAVDEPASRSRLAGLDYEVRFSLAKPPAEDRYWTTLLQCIGPGPEPVLVLLAGTRVPEHWDARLVAAGRREPRAAAVAPLCAVHPVLGLLAENAAPGLGVEDMDQWLNDYVDGGSHPVPVMLRSCMLFQGKDWPALAGEASDDRVLVDRMRCTGLSPLVTEQLYVDNAAVAEAVSLDHLPLPLLDAWVRRSPFSGLRHALSELSGRAERPPEVRSCLPVQLHVGHSWGGGLDRWIRDFVHEDLHHKHLVLRSIGDLSAFGQTIALYRSTAMDVPLRSWTLTDPTLSVAFGTPEYRRLLDEIVRDFAVESVVVSSFIGHSLDLLRLPLPVTVVLHEYFPFCPALYANFDGPCVSCTAERLRACFEQNPHNAIFRLESDLHWLAIRAEFASLLGSGLVCVVAPSHSLVDRYRALEPALLERRIHVIPHGLSRDLASSLQAVRGAAAPGGRRLRIVMLGRLSREKGGDLLAAALDDLVAFSDVWLLGTGDSGSRFASLRGVTVVREYQSAELAGLLDQVKPDLALMLSTVPESFSYTLSELRAAAIPVVATRLGALAERVSDGKDGWLIDPDPAQLVALLRQIDDQRAILDSVRSALLEAPVRSTAEMLEDYRRVVTESADIPVARYHLPRRSFRNPYAPVSAAPSAALHFNPQRPYRQALSEFLAYTARKLGRTPSLPRFFSRPVAALLGRVAVWLERR